MAMVFERLRKWLFGTVLEDPEFGRIRLCGSARPYWEGSLLFPPTGDEIWVTIRAEEEGPREEHRALMREIVARWSELEDAIAEPAAKELFRYFASDSQSQGLQQVSTPAQVFERFKLSLLNIRDVEKQEVELEFFLKDGATEHPLRVTLRNWEMVHASF